MAELHSQNKSKSPTKRQSMIDLQQFKGQSPLKRSNTILNQYTLEQQNRRLSRKSTINPLEIQKRSSLQPIKSTIFETNYDLKQNNDFVLEVDNIDFQIRGKTSKDLNIYKLFGQTIKDIKFQIKVQTMESPKPIYLSSLFPQDTNLIQDDEDNQTQKNPWKVQQELGVVFPINNLQGLMGCYLVLSLLVLFEDKEEYEEKYQGIYQIGRFLSKPQEKKSIEKTQLTLYEISQIEDFSALIYTLHHDHYKQRCFDKNPVINIKVTPMSLYDQSQKKQLKFLEQPKPQKTNQLIVQYVSFDIFDQKSQQPLQSMDLMLDILILGPDGPVYDLEGYLLEKLMQQISSILKPLNQQQQYKLDINLQANIDVNKVKSENINNLDQFVIIFGFYERDQEEQPIFIYEQPLFDKRQDLNQGNFVVKLENEQFFATFKFSIFEFFGHYFPSKNFPQISQNLTIINQQKDFRPKLPQKKEQSKSSKKNKDKKSKKPKKFLITIQEKAQQQEIQTPRLGGLLFKAKLLESIPQEQLKEFEYIIMGAINGNGKLIKDKNGYPIFNFDKIQDIIEDNKKHTPSSDNNLLQDDKLYIGQYFEINANCQDMKSKNPKDYLQYQIAIILTKSRAPSDQLYDDNLYQKVMKQKNLKLLLEESKLEGHSFLFHQIIDNSNYQPNLGNFSKNLTMYKPTSLDNVQDYYDNQTRRLLDTKLVYSINFDKDLK